ncbi:MAG: tetratricopeptide repeat protein [Pyrinomonadaceae bacterium]
MKLQNLYFSFLKYIGIAGGLSILLCLSTTYVSAQPGSGRITPTTGVSKKKITTTIKKITTIPKKTSTSSRKNKSTVTSTAKNYNYYYNLGLSLYDKGDLAGAIANYTQAIKLNPRSADAFYNRALAYYDDENYSNAVSDYTKSIQINPQADAYNNRGLAYEKYGNRTAAATDYRTALRLNPGYELAQDNLDRIEGNDNESSAGGGGGGESSAGSKNTSKTNNNSSNNAEYYAELADDYWDKMDYDNALINYTKVINLDPNEARAYMRRGFIYHYTGRVTEAYDDYNRAVKLDSSLKNEAYIKCMLYSVDEKNASMVLSECTKTINEFPSFSLAYYKRGVAYRELGNYEPSMKDFTKSIDLYPKFFNSYVYRGLLYEQLGNNNSAITEYTRAIQIVGENNELADLSYSSRGRVYENQGNYSKAAADYRKAVQLNPGNSGAKTGLTRVMQKQKSVN